jgi:hypothetical protein
MSRNRFLSVLPFALLAACASPPFAALSIEDDAELESNVVVADGALRDVVRVGRVGVERVAGSNQLKVVVPIRNIDDEPIQVLVQTSFLDGQKRPIGDDTNQQVKILGPGTTSTVVVLSKLETAQDWTMRISWNK